MAGEPPRGSDEERARAVTTRTRVREVFAGDGFRRFFAARVVSQLGDGVFQLSAAAVLLFERPGANPALDLLGITAVTLIPFSLVGPFVGVFIDRWDRRKILTRVPMLRAIVAAMLPVAALAGTHGVAFYAVVLFVLSANRFFLATMSAVLPQLVPEDDLLVANSVSSTGGAVANVAGQGIGSAIAAGIGGERAAVIAAVAFAAAAFTARRVPAHRGLEPERAPLVAELGEVVAEMRDGVRAVRSSPPVVFGLSAVAAVQVLVGGMVGVLTYYFIAVLHLTVGSATALLAALAIGIGAGVVAVPLVARRVRRDLLVVWSFLIAAAGAALAAGVLSRAAMVAGAGIVGVSYAFAKIPVDTIVQEEMGNVVRGRAFAVYDMLFNVARVAGVGIAAALYHQRASSRSIVAGIAVGYLAMAVTFGWWERRGAVRKRARRTPVDLLQPGEMVTVRAHAGHRADEEPRALVVGGHELPIDAIDWRAVVETGGRRARVFVVRVGGRRVRIAHHEDSTAWEVERVLPDRTAGIEPPRPR